MWYFGKVFRKGIQSLFVDMNSVKQLKDTLHNGQRVVLMPIYKSFSDFFILFYLNHLLGLPSCYTFGCLEDTPRIKILDSLLTSCGFIYSKRAKDQSIHTNYANSALLKEIINDN